MIYAYGITEQGTYHVKNDVVCQDAHEIVKCSNDIAIAAVADGLGTESHSDIASNIAVKTSTKHCAENIAKNTSDEDVIKLIRDSFHLAQNAIEEQAYKNGHDLDQYGTTLSLAMLICDSLYYGHSGDSGIIALTTEGLYVSITSQQQDDLGRVFQLLCNEDRWVFDKADKKVASVLLATDGMLGTFFPIYIRNEEVSIYVHLLQYLMDNNRLHIDDIGEKKTAEKISGFIQKIPDEQVNDDKTIVVLVNPVVQITPQSPGYYAEPDWVELKRKFNAAWRREAYPNLYENDVSKDSQQDKDDKGIITDVAESRPENNMGSGLSDKSVNNGGDNLKTIENKTEEI